MNMVLIGIGGALGSITRYLLTEKIKGLSDKVFPIATFIINITGAFLLGALIKLNLPQNTMNLLADGFLGAYTTFSTFMYEGFNLIKKSEYLNIILYIVLSIVIGIIGYNLGFYIF